MSGRKRDESLAALEAVLAHSFKDPAMLREALTHGSTTDGDKNKRSYERLEFLGDRVLGLIIAEHLYKTHADEDEGELAPRLNALVNRHACARAARRAGGAQAAYVCASAGARGGRRMEARLAAVCEARIAARCCRNGRRRSGAGSLMRWPSKVGRSMRRCSSSRRRSRAFPPRAARAAPSATRSARRRRRS